MPEFPAQMEQSINDYLVGGSNAKGASITGLNPSNSPAPISARFADEANRINDGRRYISRRPILDSNLFQPDR